ncbi:LysR substrate-binding domain-containing protein [Marinomonas gallaica]|uniref:LysR substrate-binding domain-containing protein n=1 Tax=Marinomonas gallaica TaxID=1806667 RepID=UPI003CE45445
MDLFKAMQCFTVTVETGSMTRAADKLNVTSAMVGQYISGLESKLGTKLLNRTTRSQHLTDFGRSYFEQCKDILERVAAAELEAEIQQNDARGLLRVTAPQTFGATKLMKALSAYRAAFPLVQLDILLTDRNVDLISEGIDIAFRIGKVPDSRLIQRKLLPYKMVLAASPEYLSLRGIPKHPNDLHAHELISFSPSARTTFTLYQFEKSLEVTFSSMVSLNSGHALLNAALAGLGLILQPKVLLDEPLNKGTLVQVLPDWQFKERHMSLLYYRDQRMTPRLRSFINFAIETFAAES